MPAFTTKTAAVTGLDATALSVSDSGNFGWQCCTDNGNFGWQ